MALAFAYYLAPEEWLLRVHALCSAPVENRALRIPAFNRESALSARRKYDIELSMRAAYRGIRVVNQVLTKGPRG